ncbi:MAG: ABC transporter transmembrane domain-containing protein [Pikeienuella sp.]
MTALYRALWKVTARKQVLLIVLSILLSGLAAAPLELQKDIINHLVDLGAVSTLVWLALGFVAVTALSAGLKFAVEYRSAMLGEATIRLVRERIYRTAAAQPADDTGLQGGTLATMVSSEAEELGRFAGEAVATPLVRVGTLLTVLAYIAAQSWVLGLITALVVIPQGLIAVLTQPQINLRVKRRVAALRTGTDLIAGDPAGATEARVIGAFGEIFEARRGIYRIKLSTKFLMNLLSGLGSATILLLGGYYVIKGQSDVGTIVVALTGLGRAVQPWRELVMFYRRASMIGVRYEMLVDRLLPQAQSRPV